MYTLIDREKRKAKKKISGKKQIKPKVKTSYIKAKKIGKI
jgi:hypothetical protein